MAIKESIQIAAIKQAYAYLDRDPDANLSKLMDLADKMDAANAYAPQRDAIRTAISDPGNNWYKLVRSLWDDVDDNVRKKLFENFVINANFLWAPRRQAAMEQYNCNIPWAILMDPTSACNLHCTGCWAAEYGNKLRSGLTSASASPPAAPTYPPISADRTDGIIRFIPSIPSGRST